MAHGGKRPGAGRKPGSLAEDTLVKLEGRRVLREMVLAQLKPMAEAQIAHAKGLSFAIVRHADGTFRRVESAEDFDRAAADGDPITIHTQQPSTAAFTDLLNRALDKPIEPYELTGAENGPVILRWQK